MSARVVVETRRCQFCGATLPAKIKRRMFRCPGCGERQYTIDARPLADARRIGPEDVGEVACYVLGVAVAVVLVLVGMGGLA